MAITVSVVMGGLLIMSFIAGVLMCRKLYVTIVYIVVLYIGLLYNVIP